MCRRIFNFIDDYSNHLEVVYNMETFYGEPVLENLLKHTKDIKLNIKKFKLIYYPSNDIEELEKSDENSKKE
jgi:hypothetical protein